MALSVAGLIIQHLGGAGVYKACPKYGVGNFSNQEAKNESSSDVSQATP